MVRADQSTRENRWWHVTAKDDSAAMRDSLPARSAFPRTIIVLFDGHEELHKELNEEDGVDDAVEDVEAVGGVGEVGRVWPRAREVGEAEARGVERR